MPVATTGKQGVMSAAMAEKVLPLTAKTSEGNTKWLKIVFIGAYNALVGLDNNNQFGTLIGVTKRTWNDSKAKLYVIYGSPSRYEYKTEDNTLYIKLSPWGYASILIFIGSVVSEDFVENPPESAESISIE